MFQSLVLQALQEAADTAEEEERDEDGNGGGFSNLPLRVKSSSVGSISSVASNLSMHSAIRGDVSVTSMRLSLGLEVPSTVGQGLRYLPAPGSSSSNVPLERFSSPSHRFPLQLVIHPGDLPDDMIFHPSTEAIIPKDTLPSSSGGGGVHGG